MIWILTLAFYYGGGTSSEFNSEAACMNAAKTAIKDSMHTRNNVSFAMCSPKGERK